MVFYFEDQSGCLQWLKLWLEERNEAMFEADPELTSSCLASKFSTSSTYDTSTLSRSRGYKFPIEGAECYYISDSDYLLDKASTCGFLLLVAASWCLRNHVCISLTD